jgi:Ni/Co efflux regulator RcnB
MKRLLAVMTVMTLAIPSVAVAREGGPDNKEQQQNAQQQGGGNQENQGGRRGSGGRQNQGGPGPRTPRASATPPPQPGPPPQAQGRGRGNFQTQNNPGPAGNENRRGDNGRRFDNNNRSDNNLRSNNNDRRFDNDRGRVVGRNFNYQRDPRAGRDFRFRGRSFVSVRAPRFAYPRGYGYRRWAIGAFLPLFFLSERYYIDYDYIGLPPPLPGTEWVRYGPDALLVDVYTGRVIDVAYGVFY